MFGKVVIVIHKEDDSCYGVTFPHYPGCVSCGDTVEEAIENAREAIQAHIESQLESGDDKTDVDFTYLGDAISSHIIEI